MSDLARTESLLSELIAFPTVSSLSNLSMIGTLAERLEHCGARVDIYEDSSGAKANLWATIGPEGDGGLVLSGHTDVVPVADQDWTHPPFELTEAEDVLYGRGTCDMKGFIAACVAMAPHWADTPLSKPLHFCFTHDEEVGCLGARALLPQLVERGINPAMAIVGEPTEMRIIEGHKGCCEYTTRFHGLAGHGSSPDLGVNAVDYAVRYAARLLALAETLKARAPDPSPFDPPWTTVNIGRLTGGTAHNVIPSKAELDWEMRPVQPNDASFVKEALSALIEDELLPEMRRVYPEATIETEVVGEVTGLLPLPENAARRLVQELTGNNSAETVPFGTEAGLFQEMGLSVVLCGPGSIAQAHKADEFVTRRELTRCLDMLGGLTRHLAA